MKAEYPKVMDHLHHMRAHAHTRTHTHTHRYIHQAKFSECNYLYGVHRTVSVTQ